MFVQVSYIFVRENYFLQVIIVYMYLQTECTYMTLYNSHPRNSRCQAQILRDKAVNHPLGIKGSHV